MIRHPYVFAALATMTLPALAAAATPPYTAAVADAARPAADTARDADRKPAEMLAFAHVKPGETVVDYMPGKGYFTRLFSAAVGPRGAVYTETPQMMVDLYAKGGHAMPPSVSTEPGRGNVHDVVASGGSFHLPAPADLVWTSQNTTTSTSSRAPRAQHSSTRRCSTRSGRAGCSSCSITPARRGSPTTG